ncbi:addiction module protein [Nannocystis punicea]|uniref:Addiction module protein n=1 Tax=Nannocystis punicea TaxID=2995304 RepID=A0ABY7H5B4_9BACT|nr:addiction module protein [Nannocystis poenicansa]WAS94476.1 addiction module protein [Nannocystis poenicansa]
MGAPTKPAEELVDEPEPSEEQLAEIEAAWEEEVLWRAKEHEEGRAESIPWEQVRAEIFGKRA